MSPAEFHDTLIACPTPTRRKLGVVVWASMWICSLAVAFLAWRNASTSTIAMQAQQDKLSRDQAMCAALLDNDDSPAVMLDEHGCVLKWNAGMEELTGLSVSEAVKGGISQVICDPLKEDKHSHGMHAAFLDPAAHNKLVYVHCAVRNVRSGEMIPVVVSVRVLDLGGSVVALARIDKEENVVEFGVPANARMREQRAEAKAAE